ncbi:MAG: FAD-binding protein [Gammaproteobacteria bacterium]|nr:FAD-binding protein [Gammaproteobacteria bacterium]
MSSSVEVIIIGAGPAGVSAALRLARAGVSVMLIEGAEYAGAENWSGCVYHAEGLLREDVLGQELWRQAPKERRIIGRSLFLHDGINAGGFEARAHAGNDFGEAWTVLRPKLDRWLASRAVDFGVTLITATTATGLRYRGDRVIGVNTDRGPISADVVFIAEGDAAGLLAREGLERSRNPHYAQGIMALFRLSPAEIERRFRLNPGEGVAQEWMVRNGQFAGRTVRVNMTAFLYTNEDSLSLGLVLPLERLAQEAVADHPHLFERVRKLPVIASYLEGAQQIAYGAKVIRSGGIDETPQWVRDGLAVGGGSLGLGQEVPYPNFIAPAITSALTFADAVLRIRGKGADYTRAELEIEYAEALRRTTDFRNATLIRRWPRAIHGGPALFDHLPAILGQMIDASHLAPSAARAQRRRALGVELARLRRDSAQLLRLARGFGPRLHADQAAPPLHVQFLVARAGAKPAPAASQEDPLMALAGEVIGHFYGRRLPAFADRVAMVWRSMARLPLLVPRVAGLGLSALYGGAALLGDLAAYRMGHVRLRALQQRPYYRYDESARIGLDWGDARRSAASPTTWIAPLVRYRPDLRHVTVSLDLGATAKQLRNVCPAEVYGLAGQFGGVSSQHENCIKCESCRVTVPGVDWNRTSGHRFAYRVPGDGRSGPDSSVTSTLDPLPEKPLILAESEGSRWQRLYQSLRARPSTVSAEWPRVWAGLLKEMSDSELTRPTVVRLESWLQRHAYGWMEAEVRALLEQAHMVPADWPSVRTRQSHALLRSIHGWERLKEDFPEKKLKALALTTWDPGSRRVLHAWIAAARSHRVAAVEWLAAWSGALAWITAGHYLAEAVAGHPITDVLAAPLWREQDGASNWIPAVAEQLIDARGDVWPAGEIIAHGAGADAAQPVRRRVDKGLGEFCATTVVAELILALARGQAAVLRRRALDYASARVQFRGDLRDSEGRESIAKFGAVKQMLAGIELACTLLELARPWCEREPTQVLLLARECMGPWMDAVPWLAGQVFGGMAYSEEDIFAPRYRDAILFSQWPGSRTFPNADPEFGMSLLRRAAESGVGPVASESLIRFAEARRRACALERPQAGPPRRKGSGTFRPLNWEAHGKFVYQSGGFLNGHLLSPDRLLVPEHFRRDPLLRRTRAEVLRLLRRGFRSPNPGEPYGRYIDALHGMPPGDIQLLREFNAFATIVPAAFGGKNWSKAQYSVLTNLCMGEKDTATGLLIMASTSIGTMPVLLGRDKDLPRLRQETGACLADAAGWQALQAGLDELIGMVERPEPGRLRRALERTGAQVQRMFLFPGSTLKYLIRDFLKLVQQTVNAAKARDLEAFADGLRRCRDELPAVRARIEEEQGDIEARERAHDRFLQFLACGQISAFALTEPAAGSDTGGIQTRAVLREAAAQPDEHGLYRFAVAGKPRLLLNAQRLVFESRRALFRMPDGRLASLDDGGWDLGRNGGRRRICVGGQSYPYDDIGTVVIKDGNAYYRYWELSGSKMWITNGSIADRYCLYAQTAFGETGFMVERRSEGLRIGPNENKLGQRASPTNELTLDGVRVSADQVIGFAGHGQVNALETLSVGRGGLVMSCAALAERALQEFSSVWLKDSQLHAAAQAERDRLQTLASRLMGLMDRADLQRGDFRIEAALSKYLASEGAHRILGWLENLYGPDAAAREAILEKWRRDIRILNIYEGTNEVQRFLVLKDLPNLFSEPAAAVSDNAVLDEALQTFRGFAAARVAKLGAGIWQNPDLQARWFPVVDWLAELYSWSALHERVRLLESHGDPADHENIVRLRASEISIARHVGEVARMVQADFEQAEHGDMAPGDAGLSLARAVLAGPGGSDDGPVAVGVLSGEWGVVLRSRFEPGGGSLEWAGWNPADLAVLDRLLCWADRHPSMRVKVAAIGPHGIVDSLRRLQAAGAEILHIVQPAGAADTAGVAREILRVWPQVRRWAFGCAAASTRDHIFVAGMTELLRVVPVQDVMAVGGGRRGLWFDDASWQRRYVAGQRRVAFVWDLKPGSRIGSYSIQSWLATLRTPVQSCEPGAELLPITVRPLALPPAANLPQRFADAGELAAWLRGRFGAGAASDGAAATRPAQAPLPGCTLWLTSADTLAGASRAPALEALVALGGAFGVLAWHPANQPPRPPSAMLAQPGFAGLWQLPLTGAVTPAALAGLLAGHVGVPRRMVLEAGEGALAAALAARIGVALFDGVTGVTPDAVTCSGEGYEVDYALPDAALLVVGRSCGGPALSVPEFAAIPVSRLPAAHLRGPVMARTQTRAVAGLTTAKLIVDVGLGAASQSNFQELVPPLCAALARLSGLAVELGATRKVTQELKLLPTDRQIGQTGVPVAPDLLMALGISGAPQHMGWIDPGAIVIAINRDPDAPIFSWSRQNPGPHVIRCVGDLGEWIPALLRLLAVDSNSAPGDGRT